MPWWSIVLLTVGGVVAVGVLAVFIAARLFLAALFRGM